MFTGQWYDDEIDQYYLRARMYDPYLARFTGRDPVLGRFEEPLSLHRYLYCRNDPVNLVDPNGEIVGYIMLVGGLGYGFRLRMTHAYWTHQAYAYAIGAIGALYELSKFWDIPEGIARWFLSKIKETKARPVKPLDYYEDIWPLVPGTPEANEANEANLPP
jgi:RHS repeat-associated protein